jgi:hypothetical protein
VNLSQTAKLLGAMAAFDRRTVGDMDVAAWQSVLDDVAFDDALLAVREWYADHTEWMMPAHVRRAVERMERERERAARATGWAPGQAGVPKGRALPEITGPVDESVLTRPVRELLASMGVHLPEGSREALMPRRVAWEREHRAYLRVRDGEPNPDYRPQQGPPCTCDLNDMSGGHATDCPRATW